MEQLTGLDAAFLYLETPNSPMHIGGVSILDSRTPAGRLGLDDLRRLLASRLHRSRTFTQRLVEVPLNLGKPYWIEDEEFDLDRHLERTQLPEPGGWKELSALVSWELAQPLPRDRPLWQMLLVEGVDGIDGVPPGSVALISRIHHAAIDGVSGAQILSALFDVSPEAPAVEAAPGSRQEEPREMRSEEREPSKVELLRETGRHLVAAPAALGDALGGTVKGLVKGGLAWGLKRVKPPPLPFSAPRTRLNVPVGPERIWSPALLSLKRIKEIRRRLDATVNDVVLAICAGALRRYLEDLDALPKKPLVAMVPISVRAEDEHGRMGNRVSAMLVSLATDQADPGERLRRICDSTAGSKLYHQAVGARNLSDFGEFVPFGVGGLGARLYTRMHLAEKHKPIFNVVITNVPGPQIPLYVAGARLLGQIGVAPIFDGMGLILPIFSYHGTLSIGATSDRGIMPDLDRFARYLGESLDDLEATVG